METAPTPPLLMVAVVDDHPAEVYALAQVLHAQGFAYILQVLESWQRVQHFLARLAAPAGVLTSSCWMARSQDGTPASCSTGSTLSPGIGVDAWS